MDLYASIRFSIAGFSDNTDESKDAPQNDQTSSNTTIDNKSQGVFVCTENGNYLQASSRSFILIKHHSDIKEYKALSDPILSNDKTTMTYVVTMNDNNDDDTQEAKQKEEIHLDYVIDKNTWLEINMESNKVESEYIAFNDMFNKSNSDNTNYTSAPTDILDCIDSGDDNRNASVNDVHLTEKKETIATMTNSNSNSSIPNSDDNSEEKKVEIKKEKEKEKGRKEENDILKRKISRKFTWSEATQHIVVLGDTGVGKSSLIKLLTKNDAVKTSTPDDPNACTKNIQWYIMEDGNLIYDTQGTQDTDMNQINDTINQIDDEKSDLSNTENPDKKDSDHESKSKDTEGDDNTQDKKMNEIINQDTSILNKIQREIYKNGTKTYNLVKIIWIVKCANRADAHLQFQAQFINKFNFLELSEDGKEVHISENDNSIKNSTSIWDSVLLIVSKPQAYEELLDCAQGAIAAADRNGCQSNFTILNKDSEDETKTNDFWKENKNLIGYSNIEWFAKKQMKKANACYKSQINGNNRDFHYYKSNEIEAMVNNSLNNHIPHYRIQWRKDICLRCGHIGDSRFFNDIYCHTKPFRRHRANIKTKHVAEMGDNTNQGKNKIRYHCGQKKSFHKSPASRKYHSGKKTWMHSSHISGYFYRTQDMIVSASKTGDEILGVVGMIVSPIGAPAYTTACVVSDICTYCGHDKKAKGGCMWIYDCCGKFNDSRGCKTFKNGEIRYLCCDKLFGEEGCCYYYDCCAKFEYNTGCPNSNTNIKDEYGVGCVTKCSHCDVDLYSLKQDYVIDRKLKNEKEKECGFIWECCGKEGPWTDRDNQDLKCYTVCDGCNREWGSSKGCNPLTNHQIVPYKQNVSITSSGINGGRRRNNATTVNDVDKDEDMIDVD